MTDAVIIGGGLIGLLTARELALAGQRVCVVDRGAVGREASWAGGGILSPLYPWRQPEAVTRLARWSQAHYPGLAETLLTEGGVDPEYQPSGLLILDLEERDRALVWARDHEVDITGVSGEQLRALEPGLRKDADGALWLAAVAQVRNPRLLAALVASLRRLGVEVCEHREVMRLLAQGHQTVGVETTRGPLYADAVVVAGGAWSADLLRASGVHIDCEPVRGQMLLYQARPGLVLHILLDHGRYVIPRRDGHILVGSTVEHVGFDKTVTGEAFTYLQQAALALVPALEDFPIVNHWAGLRPGSPEGIPVIGPVSGHPGLFVSTGHFRNGVTLAPASARLLADLILRRAPVLDPHPYRI